MKQKTAASQVTPINFPKRVSSLTCRPKGPTVTQFVCVAAEVSSIRTATCGNEQRLEHNTADLTGTSNSRVAATSTYIQTGALDDARDSFPCTRWSRLSPVGPSLDRRDRLSGGKLPHLSRTDVRD